MQIFIFFLAFSFFGAVNSVHAAKAFDHTHKAWTQILKKNVGVDGPASTFDYAGLKKSHGNLDTYLKTLGGR